MGTRGVIVLVGVLLVGVVCLHAMHGRAHRWLARWAPAIHGHR